MAIALILSAGCIESKRQRPASDTASETERDSRPETAQDTEVDSASDTVADVPCTLECATLPAETCRKVTLDEARCECIWTDAPHDTPCDDGNICSGDDRCQGAVCAGVAEVTETGCKDGDCGECADGCECLWRCSEDACDGACRQGSTCVVDLSEADGHSDIECREGSTCEVDGRGGKMVHVKCYDDATCDVDCRNGDGCRISECRGNASCMVRCGDDADDCELRNCGEAMGEPERCPGDILVCNRPCP